MCVPRPRGICQFNPIHRAADARRHQGPLQNALMIKIPKRAGIRQQPTVTVLFFALIVSSGDRTAAPSIPIPVRQRPKGVPSQKNPATIVSGD